MQIDVYYGEMFLMEHVNPSVGDGKEIRCSVTVMPVISVDGRYKIGFIRRSKGDTYAKMLVAAGGKLESKDGVLIEGVKYFSVEGCAIRELLEECRLRIPRHKLKYFCSLTLPNGRVVISMYCLSDAKPHSRSIIYLSESEIKKRRDFAPGMKQESLLLLKKLSSNRSEER
jgi:8-oxo-dGTP pyrophosphatase MutT (NUDIX family)